MGRLLLMWRLARGDIRRRWLRSLLMLTVLAAATSTVTVALALYGVTDSPFARTRIATKGPDVAGLFEPGFHGTGGTYQQFVAFRDTPGVVGSSGPFPIATVELNANGRQIRVHAEGRAPAAAALDQPLVTAGRWVTPRGVVLERGFADALGVQVGDTVNLDGQRLRVSGVAVTSALSTTDPWVWVTQTILDALAAGKPTWYALNLKLADPAAAPSFAALRNGGDTAWYLESWQQIRNDDSIQIRSEQQVLEAGAALLAVIALAGIAVMVGTRMTEQTRRVGLLKAVGATPRTVAVILLVENLLIAIAAAAVGVLAGRLAAPTLTTAGNTLLDPPARPPSPPEPPPSSPCWPSRSRRQPPPGPPSKAPGPAPFGPWPTQPGHPSATDASSTCRTAYPPHFYSPCAPAPAGPPGPCSPSPASPSPSPPRWPPSPSATPPCSA